jgi:hypothetical protein
VIYQDPLAYLLGLEGIALLDAWAGDHDREFTETRLAEIRRLLDDEKLRDCGVRAERASTVTAYEQRSASYDAEAGGGLLRRHGFGFIFGQAGQVTVLVAGGPAVLRRGRSA